MGKYASGTGLKTVIEEEVQHAEEIVARSQIEESDADELIMIIKEMAYRWCCSNASARATEEAVRTHVPADEFCEIMKDTLYNGVYEAVMLETLPEFDREELEDILGGGEGEE